MDIGKTIGIVAGGVTLLYFGKKAKDFFDEVADKNLLKKNQNSTILPPKGKKVLYDLNGKPIKSANLSTIAADLDNALSFPVDQDRVVRVFKSTPFGYVKDLETLFLDDYKYNLKDKMVKKLSDKNWINVKFWFV